MIYNSYAIQFFRTYISYLCNLFLVIIRKYLMKQLIYIKRSQCYVTCRILGMQDEKNCRRT